MSHEKNRPAPPNIIENIRNGSFGNASNLKAGWNESDPKHRLFAIHWAIVKGDVFSLKNLIDEGVDVELKDGEGLTPLHHAVLFRRLDAIKVLLEHNVNVNPISMFRFNDAHNIESSRLVTPLDLVEAPWSKVKSKSEELNVGIHKKAWHGHKEKVVALLNEIEAQHAKEKVGPLALFESSFRQILHGWPKVPGVFLHLWFLQVLLFLLLIYMIWIKIQKVLNFLFLTRPSSSLG